MVSASGREGSREGPVVGEAVQRATDDLTRPREHERERRRVVRAADRRAGLAARNACSRCGRPQRKAPSVPKMSVPRLAIGPQLSEFAVDAVVAGGGEVVRIDERPAGLIWLHGGDPAGLSSYLARAPDVEWVQLPMAGIEAFAEVGLLDPELLWTCAKGAFAEPVAEHALALALAGLRQLPTRLAARTWGSPSGTSLFGEAVTILGGGGITTALLELLKPFRVQATVVRRRPMPVAGAKRTVGVEAARRCPAGSPGGLPCPRAHACDRRDHRRTRTRLDGRDLLAGQRCSRQARGD